MPAEITRIKICGLRGADAAVAASNAGADFLGFNFVEGVRRYPGYNGAVLVPVGLSMHELVEWVLGAPLGTFRSAIIASIPL